MGVIKIEGKSVALDDSIIDGGIQAIKLALMVDFPDIENADIEIVGSRAPGVARSATVVKRGTGKGAQLLSVTEEIISSLLATPEYINPAIELAVEVQELETSGHREDVDKLLRSPAVEKAIVAGEREGRAVLRSLAACGHAPPVASKKVPVGF